MFLPQIPGLRFFSPCCVAGDVKKTLNLIVFLPPFLLFINKYCLPKHNIQWTGRESYWSNFYFDSQVVSLSVIHMICAILLGIGKYLNEYYFHFTQKQIYLP